MVPRPRSATRHLPRARRGGFTLAELVVALVLLAWGALALVAASASAVRTVSAAEAQTLAVATARDRTERLAAAGCALLRAGTAVDSVRAVRERWTVAVFRNGARLLTDSVEYVDRDAPRHVVLQRLVVC